MNLEKTSSIVEKWALPVSKEENIKSDREIAAWEEGKKDGITELQRGLNTLLKTNMSMAWTLASSLIDSVKEKEIIKPAIKLRVNTFDCFDILVLIPENILHSDDSDSIYSLISELEQINPDSDMKIHFSLIGVNENTDQGLMEVEGFTYNYVYKNEP